MANHQQSTDRNSRAGNIGDAAVNRGTAGTGACATLFHDQVDELVWDGDNLYDGSSFEQRCDLFVVFGECD
jgi:hypothetical protein